jgi:hypothetical protein
VRRTAIPGTDREEWKKCEKWINCLIVVVGWRGQECLPNGQLAVFPEDYDRNEVFPTLERISISKTILI